MTILSRITLGDLCHILKDSPTHSFTIGQCIFVRTVAFYYTGRVEMVTDSDIVLSEAAWIASTGRFADSLKTGNMDEVEPYPNRVVLNRSAIIDWCEWAHPLPRTQK